MDWVPHLRYTQMARVSRLVVAGRVVRLARSLPPGRTVFGQPNISSVVALQAKRRVAGELADLDIRWLLLGSVSRVMNDIVSASHRELAQETREILAAYRETADLIEVGAYAPGSSAAIDRAIRLKPDIDELLRQDAGEAADVASTVAAMEALGLLDGLPATVGADR